MNNDKNANECADRYWYLKNHVHILSLHNLYIVSRRRGTKQEDNRTGNMRNPFIHL